MDSKRFSAKLVRPDGIGTWTYVTANFDAEKVFGKRGRIPVSGRIDGHTFRGSLMPHGDGRHFVVVKKELRDTIKKEAGATVQVELALDTKARVLALPKRLKETFRQEPTAKAAFATMS